VKLRTGAIIGLVIVMLGVGGGVASKRVRGAVLGRLFSSTNAPRGVRVRVEVLNATTTRGLARRATQLLRDRGFDVVDVRTSPAREQGDSTIVLDRSGHPDWARRVAAAMGGARVISRPDSSRYLDVTVLVGGSWRPPAQPFNP
jgi:LytR cell envelope-related transcriptional attenuator